MRGPSAAAGTLVELRRCFDAAFAVPPQPREEGLEGLLLIRAGGEALALKTLHLEGVARIGRILPIPSRMPELLGITGIRGTLAPVFDLAALLGLRTGGAPPRWLAFPRGETRMAFALEEMEGQISVSRTSLYDHHGSSAREYIHQMARMEHAERALADIPAVVDAIRRRAGPMQSDYPVPPENQSPQKRSDIR